MNMNIAVLVPILIVIGAGLLGFIIVLIVLYDKGLLQGKKRVAPYEDSAEQESETIKHSHQDFIENMESSTENLNRAVTTYKTTKSFEEKNDRNTSITESRAYQELQYHEQQRVMRQQQQDTDMLMQNMALQMNNTFNKF